jgi:hypothetical protein
MENTQTENPVIEETADLKMIFSSRYDIIIEKTYRIDDMYWDIEKEGMNSYLLKNIRELVSELFSELSVLFKSEEDIIFFEVEQAVDGLSSVAAIRTENNSILSMLETLKKTLGCKSDIRKDKELLQAEMIAVEDLIQRNIYKKENIFSNEVSILLNEEKLASILQKMRTTV